MTKLERWCIKNKLYNRIDKFLYNYSRNILLLKFADWELFERLK